MGLGTITKYKVGYELYGLKIKRIFPETYLKSHLQKRWIYIPTEYYITYDCDRGVGPEPFIVPEYRLNTLIHELIRNRRKPKGLKSNKVKMLDKKYES